MDQTQQRALLRRTLAHLDHRTTDIADTEVAYPITDYCDDSRLRREIDSIFRRLPIIVAHISELKRPGDFVTDSVCGIPIVVTQTAAGAVKAFINGCRHRGAQLVTEPAGSNLVNFVCPYHAWRYDADGALRRVPDQENCFPNLDTSALSLVPLPVEVRHGLVWVTLAKGSPMPPLESYLGALDPELAAYRFEDYVLYRQESLVRSFNWKLGMEAFLENYHFAVLHKNSASRIFIHNVAAIDRFGWHVRAIAPKRTVTQLDRKHDEDWDLRRNTTILYSIFPNSCVFLEKSHFSLLQIVPEDVDRSRIRMMHVVRQDSLQMRRFWDENIRIFMSAVDEDLMICESMQRGLRSGANEQLLFGRNEVGCMTFRQSIEEAMSGADGPQQLGDGRVTIGAGAGRSL